MSQMSNQKTLSIIYIDPKQDNYIFFIVLKFQSMDLAQTLGQLGLKTLFDPLRSNLTNFISEESQQSDRVSFNR